MSHTNQNDSNEDVKDMKNNNDDDEYKDDTLKHPDGNESFYNPETSDISRNESVINTTKKRRSIDETVDVHECQKACNTICDRYCYFFLVEMI